MKIKCFSKRKLNVRKIQIFTNLQPFNFNLQQDLKIAAFWENKPLPPPRRSRGGGLSNVFILLIQKVSAIHVSIYCSCEMFEVF